MKQRIIFTSILVVAITSASLAQKEDYYWPFGQDNSQTTAPETLVFDFNNSPFDIETREGLEFDQMNASMCDAEGNLLFYTNGCAVANRHHQVMPHGDSINAGLFFDFVWQGRCEWGYPGQQNVTILNDPSTADGYYLFQVPRFIETPIADTEIYLHYSYIDMALDNGNGDVTIKNEVLYDDTEVLSSYLTSIRHANGEDWWIINPVFPQGYLVYLLSNEGLTFSSIQDGPVWDTFFSSSSGDARFSPDGQHYALFNKWEGVRLYDFDREHGTLSNEQVIPWVYYGAGTGGFTTCEWSPSSRFLYLAQADSLFQVDTSVEPLIDGLVFIEEYNGLLDPVGTFFFKSALGPDCRIYIRPGSSSNSFHVINKPDELGQACDFVQQGIRLPHISSSGSFPNFPRFRVDETEKCDPQITSILGEDIYWRRELVAFPNPVRDHLTIDLTSGINIRGQVYIIDIQGKVVREQAINNNDMVTLDMSNYPVGTYSIEFVPDDNKDRLIWTTMVVKVE
jgi:hypothetical protein